MARSPIVDKILNKKVKDYSLTIAFFFVFSFFLIFAIRPNITTAFSLQNELASLKETDRTYETIILSIVRIQSILEQNRDNFYLLDQALPKSPLVNQVVDEVVLTASASGVTFKQVDVSEVKIVNSKEKNTLKRYAVTLVTDSDFTAIKKVLDELNSQRRLKTVKELSVTSTLGQENVSSKSAGLEISMEVEGYYL